MTVVLDLGAHDGFIGAWLQTQLSGVEVDGIELHPRGVQEALRRGYRHVAQADALDAAEHFTPGTYDAVVAFEILEHVPNMDAFLAVCERMVKPGGLVFCSTPDGTFGEGGNPHHLRTLRALDLAELLRRRGRLEDLLPGPDGIAVAAYRPDRHAGRRGECAIHTGGGWQTWSPVDVAERGLGGSETAAVHLALALTDLGWTVTVYGEIADQCIFRNVVFRHHSVFDPMDRRELLIASRLPELFDRPGLAAHRMLWFHDVDAGDRLTVERAAQANDVLVLSGWHERHVHDIYPFLNGKVRRIRNGIDPGLFDGPVPKRRKRVVYTSSPDRGLDVLLERIWPLVRERVPDAELAYAYSPVYFAIAEQDATVGKHAARIRELADQPGVTNLDSLSQPQVADLMRHSLVWAAPSYNTPSDQPFHETSCIGAMEAQAAGCWVVASNWGALPETVQVGALIDGPALSDGWVVAFVESIVQGLTDRTLQKHVQEAGPAAASGLDWAGPAAEIDALAGTIL